jgi:Flp pilus assembly protein TadD
LNPAAISLARQARNQYLAQDYQGAIATAERGLRIERRAADLYLVLAQSYVQLDQPQKAEMFVQQGLRFAPQGSDVASGLLRVRELIGN